MGDSPDEHHHMPPYSQDTGLNPMAIAKRCTAAGFVLLVGCSQPQPSPVPPMAARAASPPVDALASVPCARASSDASSTQTSRRFALNLACEMAISHAPGGLARMRLRFPDGSERVLLRRGSRIMDAGGNDVQFLHSDQARLIQAGTDRFLIPEHLLQRQTKRIQEPASAAVRTGS